MANSNKNGQTITAELAVDVKEVNYGRNVDNGNIYAEFIVSLDKETFANCLKKAEESIGKKIDGYESEQGKVNISIFADTNDLEMFIAADVEKGNNDSSQSATLYEVPLSSDEKELYRSAIADNLQKDGSEGIDYFLYKARAAFN